MAGGERVCFRCGGPAAAVWVGDSLPACSSIEVYLYCRWHTDTLLQDEHVRDAYAPYGDRIHVLDLGGEAFSLSTAHRLEPWSWDRAVYDDWRASDSYEPCRVPRDEEATPPTVSAPASPGRAVRWWSPTVLISLLLGLSLLRVLLAWGRSA